MITGMILINNNINKMRHTLRIVLSKIRHSIEITIGKRESLKNYIRSKLNSTYYSNPEFQLILNTKKKKQSNSLITFFLLKAFQQTTFMDCFFLYVINN